MITLGQLKHKKRLALFLISILAVFELSACGKIAIQAPQTMNFKESKITNISVPILEYHNSAYIKNWPWSLKPGQFSEEMAWLHDQILIRLHSNNSMTLINMGQNFRVVLL